ncbi:hypothetical protein PTSG_01288 [Salpingoeca rosetta]|uniref:Uncharacterized protein n=1 Tax=Salpingoeca rosetta (strain ATCC 50818 / BSB-021) TaxID=946362 RepID=F2TZX0_SALR5|nr:uncharacterized protein PTSG_01288 [Salpingoeca rosetta]EGD80698.1 hypothetical protein PTSG_01288 [Salpingoeca rosetta]|eukprot:XP_004997259.1 hypothetical protein PTSG_01288 [Salpingoeca rosetta]
MSKVTVRCTDVRAESVRSIRGIRTAQTLHLYACVIHPCFINSLGRALQDPERDLDELLLCDCDFADNAFPELLKALDRVRHHNPLKFLLLEYSGIHSPGPFTAHELTCLLHSVQRLRLSGGSLLARDLRAIGAPTPPATDPTQPSPSSQSRSPFAAVLQDLALDNIRLVDDESDTDTADDTHPDADHQHQRGRPHNLASIASAIAHHQHQQQHGISGDDAHTSRAPASQAPLSSSPASTAPTRCAAAALGDALLAVCPHIHRLDLQYTRLSTNGAQRLLARVCRLARLTHLTINWCDVPGQAACRGLFNPEAPAPPQLQLLSVDVTSWPRECCSNVTAWLARGHPCLQHLSIHREDVVLRPEGREHRHEWYTSIARASLQCPHMSALQLPTWNDDATEDVAEALVAVVQSDTVRAGRVAAHRVAMTGRLSRMDAEVIAEYLPILHCMCTRDDAVACTKDGLLRLLRGLPEWRVLVGLGAAQIVPQHVAQAMLPPNMCSPPWVWQRLQRFDATAPVAVTTTTNTETGMETTTVTAETSDTRGGAGDEHTTTATTRQRLGSLRVTSQRQHVPTLQQMCCLALRCQIMQSEADIVSALPKLPFLNLPSARVDFFFGIDIQPIL